MAPAAAVPVKVSVLSLVTPSPTVPLSVEYELIVGALGATVSTVTARTVEAALMWPRPSFAVAVKLWVASVSAPVVKVQAPLPSATAVPSSVAPS